jgi:hypothetical protein
MAQEPGIKVSLASVTCQTHNTHINDRSSLSWLNVIDASIKVEGLSWFYWPLTL